MQRNTDGHRRSEAHSPEIWAREAAAYRDWLFRCWSRADQVRPDMEIQLVTANIRSADGSPYPLRVVELTARQHRANIETWHVIAQIASRQPPGRDGTAGGIITIWTPIVSRQRPGCSEPRRHG